jgi:threonine synthase
MSTLLFRSTNGRSPAVNLREAFLAGQAPDGGLYLPERFPRLTAKEIAEYAELPYRKVAFRVLRKFTEGVIPDDALSAMCDKAYDFGVPLEVIHHGVYLMRLDQGPTASFKDFAVQMMAQMFGRFLKEKSPSSPRPAAILARPSPMRSTRCPACASSCCSRSTR